MAEAERAVHEDLGLDGGVFCDVPDLLQAELAGQHGAGAAHLGGRLDARQIVDAHLRARVDRDVGQGAADHGRKAQILNENGVRPLVGHESRRIQRGLHLPVADQGVQRDIDLAAADAAVARGLAELLFGKVFRTAAGVEAAQAQIDRVRAVLHGGDDGFRGTGGR